MHQITRKLEFDAGHRVLGHENKCAHLHGHRYIAEVTVEAPTLDSVSRVVDFSVVKELVGGWVDEFWDHNMLLNSEDPLIRAARLLNNIQLRQRLALARVSLVRADDKPAGPGYGDALFGPFKQPYIIPKGENPTAEVMAKILLDKAQELLPNLTVTHVRIYETPNCWADCYKEPVA